MGNKNRYQDKEGLFDDFFLDFFVSLGCFIEVVLGIGIFFYLVFNFMENYFYEDGLWVNLFIEKVFEYYCK